MKKNYFRFWHKNLKQFVKLLGSELDSNVNDLFLSENVIPSQRTGLLDRNNKDIYEADIIKCSYDEFHKDEIYEVYYNGAGFSPFADNDDGCPYPNASKCIIIGNIYETPELLQGEI